MSRDELTKIILPEDKLPKFCIMSRQICPTLVPWFTSGNQRSVNPS